MALQLSSQRCLQRLSRSLALAPSTTSGASNTTTANPTSSGTVYSLARSFFSTSSRPVCVRSFHTSIPTWKDEQINDGAAAETTTSPSNNDNATSKKHKSAVRHSVHQTAPSFKATKVFFTGELESVNIKTTELLRTSKIHARDLFDLHLTSRQERRNRKIKARAPERRCLAAIVPRQSSIVLSFAQIRAICGRHYVLFLDAHDPAVQEFAQDLALTYRTIAEKQNYQRLTAPHCNRTDGSVREAGELIFLEEVLRNTVECFNRRLCIYDPIVEAFLTSVANEVYSDTGVHQLVPLKDSLQSFEMDIKQCLDCLTQLLAHDEEMLALLLTEQAKAHETGQAVAFDRHQHVELLLGVYARQLNNTLMEIQFVLQRIQSKQEFVTLALAGYRNRMIRMNVNISIATLALCLGTTVAGFYGMNVVNGFEQSTTAFSTIVMWSSVAGMTVGAGALNYLSGRTMQVRAAQRLYEIETLSGALSDMGALDYAVKSSLDHGTAISKDEFRVKLRQARQSGEVTDKEVDLLFHALDTVKDGMIGKDDFDVFRLSNSLSETPNNPPSTIPHMRTKEP
jgi:Mg2+ and Co2+ transporter CorA